MRVLVLGGASLVGSHLCDRFIDEGHEVIAVDDLSAGSWANVAHLKGQPRFLFVEHDVTSRFHATVDAIFHLALPSSLRRGDDDLKATATCVAGTLHALETAALVGAPIVLATSIGDADDGVRCAEALALDFARSRGVDARVVRFAPAFGARMAHDDLVARVVLQALRGEPIDPGCRADHVLHLVHAPEAAGVLADVLAHDVAPSLRSIGGDGASGPSLVGRGPLEAPFLETTVGEVVRVVREVTASIDALADEECEIGSLRDGIECTVRWFAERLAKKPLDSTSGVYARSSTPPPLPEVARAAG
jgi:nucleoside-diphosphate-sugar epimerase